MAASWSKNDEAITNMCIEQRGKILNAMANIELLLNGYLARHFCGENIPKIEEIILLIFGDDRISLNSKAQIFVEIATTHDKKWYSEYKSPRVPKDPKKPYSLNSDLVYVIQERNIFAHRLLITSDLFNGTPLPKDVLRFVKFKNDIEPLDYTKTKLHEIYICIMYIGRHFIPKLDDLNAFDLV